MRPTFHYLQKGKWPLADCWMGDGWSVAYRVLDSQFWGVPQRRRRIALVADFGGHAAPEISFVRQSVCGDITEGGAAGEEDSAGAESGAGQAIPINTMLATRHKQLGRGTGFGIGEPGEPEFTISTNHCHAVFQPSVICLNDQGGSIMGTSIDVAGTLREQEHGHQPVIFAKGRTDCLTGWDNQEKCVFSAKGVAPTLSGSDGGGGRTVCGYIYDARENGDRKVVSVFENHGQDSRITGPLDVFPTVSAKFGTGGNNTPLVMATGQAGAEILKNLCPTLNCNNEQPIVTGVDCRNGTESPDVVATLQAHNNGGFSLNCTHPVRICGQVRRLTPMECERLQGYPDGWTDIGPWTDSAGKLHKESSDSARYKALGNSIALPPWSWVLKRLCACYERTATMASLFDGIGGFPLIWERLNGPGTCLWASEIEEFPIAVTKRRFGGTADE